jgi:DNA-binding NarL/FixJ family response regulator
MEIIKVLLADDHGVVRSGIKSLLETENDIEVIGEASNGQEALAKAKMLQPNLIIIDVRMPVLNGIEATRKIRQEVPDTRVLVLSMHDDEEYVLQALECGASGYLLKDASKDEFLKAVKMIHQGEMYFSGELSGVLVSGFRKKAPSETSEATVDYDLTKREKQILSMLTQGINNKDIADKLDKSVRTIETHRFNIMKKLKVNNVVELLKKVEEERGLKELITTY